MDARIGRPRIGKARQIRLADDEWQQVNHLAQSGGVTASAWVREAIRAKLGTTDYSAIASSSLKRSMVEAGYHVREKDDGVFEVRKRADSDCASTPYDGHFWRL